LRSQSNTKNRRGLRDDEQYVANTAPPEIHKLNLSQMVKNMPSRELDFEDTVSEPSSSSDVNSASESNKKKEDKEKKQSKKPESAQSGSKFTHSRFSSNVEDLDVDVEGEIENTNPTNPPQNNAYGNGGTGKGRRGLDIDMAEVEVNEIKGLGSQGKQLVQLIE
jgi:hypothetical protein